MKPVTDSQRILKALDEQDQAFRKLATGPLDVLTKANREIVVGLKEYASPGHRLAEQLRSQPYQRATEIAQQLSRASTGTYPAPPPRSDTSLSQNPGERVRTVAELGVLVRLARKAMKMNQSEFAAHAGVGRRFVSELEGGKASLEFDRVMACAGAAGIDLTARVRSR
ncbi:MAG: helix-turn-helix transcriptional regulator [Proteobacteria bacterium]|nr:helix-turn-helix transcriptional regulator [Pseudomonadota bacterium]